jgi:hypothetical protein
LLLEAKERGLLDDKSQESQEEFQRRRLDRFDDESDEKLKSKHWIFPMDSETERFGFFSAPT